MAASSRWHTHPPAALLSARWFVLQTDVNPVRVGLWPWSLVLLWHTHVWWFWIPAFSGTLDSLSVFWFWPVRMWVQTPPVRRRRIFLVPCALRAVNHQQRRSPPAGSGVHPPTSSSVFTSNRRDLERQRGSKRTLSSASPASGATSDCWCLSTSGVDLAALVILSRH